ncbi:MULTISPECIES: cutinase family protein [unclassified Nocardia]|uniref:cutinase family protein n=1 Tax=unclassified Nocardia TaxID=2637762 RepID=UPI001CE49768|nr:MULTISPECIES: cutinase family protein [unclassified Nocardia]
MLYGRLLPSVRCRAAGAALVVCLAVMGAGTARAESEDPSAVPDQGCPPLYVLGVQGTGQSAPDADLTSDSGLLATILGPLTGMGHALVARAYVPYAAGFGGAVPGGPLPYSASVSGGLDKLREMAAEVVRHCPATELGMVGYSQGAHIVSMFAQEVGQGAGVVPADRVAAVALLADPTRGPAAPLFPGAPGSSGPDPAPGTTGANVSGLSVAAQETASGGGIGPERDIATDFGALTGRVASFCIPGDLSCDAPTGIPLLRMLVNIAGQSELDPADPLAALASIAEVARETAAKTATAVVNQDVLGYSLGTLALAPGLPLSRRLAEASDPRETPDVRQALSKIAASAFNSVTLALTGTALPMGDLAEVMTVGATDPLAGLACLAQKILAAAHNPPPRPAAHRLLSEIFDAVGQVIAEGGQLLDPEIWSKYLDTVRRHGAYAVAAFTTGGDPAVRFVTDWFTAVARDLAGHRIPRAAPTPVGLAPTAPNPPTPDPVATPEQPAPIQVSNMAEQPSAPDTHSRQSGDPHPLGYGHRPEPYLTWLLILLSVSAALWGLGRLVARYLTRNL